MLLEQQRSEKYLSGKALTITLIFISLLIALCVALIFYITDENRNREEIRKQIKIRRKNDEEEQIDFQLKTSYLKVRGNNLSESDDLEIKKIINSASESKFKDNLYRIIFYMQKKVFKHENVSNLFKKIEKTNFHDENDALKYQAFYSAIKQLKNKSEQHLKKNLNFK